MADISEWKFCFIFSVLWGDVSQNIFKICWKLRTKDPKLKTAWGSCQWISQGRIMVRFRNLEKHSIYSLFSRWCIERMCWSMYYFVPFVIKLVAFYVVLACCSYLIFFVCQQHWSKKKKQTTFSSHHGKTFSVAFAHLAKIVTWSLFHRSSFLNLPAWLFWEFCNHLRKTSLCIYQC